MSPISSTSVPRPDEECPECGTPLAVPDGATTTTCSSCGTDLTKAPKGGWTASSK
jgi:LSD1 subclass zinc finger protein